MTTTKNPETPWAKNFPELEFQTPLGRFKSLVLAPDFLTYFKVSKVIIGLVSDGSYEVNLILVPEVGNSPLFFELLQKLKTLGFAFGVKGVPGMGDTLRVEFIVFGKH